MTFVGGFDSRFFLPKKLEPQIEFFEEKLKHRKSLFLAYRECELRVKIGVQRFSFGRTDKAKALDSKRAKSEGLDSIFKKKFNS